MEIGALIPGRFQVLQQNQWLPLETLLAVDQNSPYYNERDRAGVFYAESWALIHMLNLSKPYRPEYGKFVTAIVSGLPAANAFWQVYAKTTAMVQKDIEQYLSGSSFYAMFFNIKVQKSDEEPDIEPAPPLESGMVQADLFALTDKKEEAAEKYESLAKQFPKKWEPEAGLAELALRAKSIEGARRHLARAAELGATTPRLYYEYATILHEAGEKDAALVPVLKKAVELDPDYEEAHRYLAFCLLATEDYQDAVEGEKIKARRGLRILLCAGIRKLSAGPTRCREEICRSRAKVCPHPRADRDGRRDAPRREPGADRNGCPAHWPRGRPYTAHRTDGPRATNREQRAGRLCTSGRRARETPGAKTRSS
ncbi:MAG: hypothetical protein DMG57_26135 [Acidobacteria bacterium]|nr:MAG: hypothetical protein DMG57_26135 [Acidobacteriota bacterium]